MKGKVSKKKVENYALRKNKNEELFAIAVCYFKERGS
jgi:hypothetical protein